MFPPQVKATHEISTLRARSVATPPQALLQQLPLVVVVVEEVDRLERRLRLLVQRRQAGEVLEERAAVEGLQQEVVAALAQAVDDDVGARGAVRKGRAAHALGPEAREHTAHLPRKREPPEGFRRGRRWGPLK